ncbi:MAG: hypothetical protein PHN72_00155 [Bacilli bacterium]|nr:hypothetical protein [Bacilli bacterium]
MKAKHYIILILIIVACLLLKYDVDRKEQNKTEAEKKQEEIQEEEKKIETTGKLIASTSAQRVIGAILIEYNLKLLTDAPYAYGKEYDIKDIKVSGEAPASGTFIIYEDGTITLKDVVLSGYTCNGTKETQICSKKIDE